MELSFVDVEDILAVNEGLFKRLFKDVLGKELPTPFRRMTYTEAMENYGSDKPDIRFDMKLQDISDLVKDCGFGVFTGAIANGGSVRAIIAKNAASVYTRKEIDKLTEYVKGIGAKGLAYVRWVDEPNASFKKFMTEDELNAIYERLGAEKGDVILIVADKNSTVLSTLGALRLKIAKRLNIIPDEFSFLWIVDFPFFEKDEETGEWLAMHHPFTMPKEGSAPSSSRTRKSKPSSASLWKPTNTAHRLTAAWASVLTASPCCSAAPTACATSPPSRRCRTRAS